MIRDIAGRQNQSVRLARKLQQKKHRRERGLIVCEGMDLLWAAVNSGADLHEVLVREDLREALPTSLLERAATAESGEVGPHVGVCARETLEYASSLGGGADVLFVCPQPSRSLADLSLGDDAVFYLEGVGDPGNVGTIVRSSHAFGLGGVVCSPQTADPFSPKAMRAGMGAQFEHPVVTEVSHADLEARMEVVAGKGGALPSVVVADAHEGDEVGDCRSLLADSVIVLGAERTGASGAWREAKKVRIEQCRGESLNVGMAATILAYEARSASCASDVGN